MRVGVSQLTHKYVFRHSWEWRPIEKLTTITMITNIRHPMIGSKDKRCPSIIVIKVLEQRLNLSDDIVHRLDIVHILYRMWSPTVAGRIKAEKMQEEEGLRLSETRLEEFVGFSTMKECFELVQYEIVDLSSLCECTRDTNISITSARLSSLF